MKKGIRLAAIAVCIAIGLVALPAPSAAQAQTTTYRAEVPLDGYFTPTDFPCLNETVHIFGMLKDYSVEVINPQGIGHTTFRETPNLTAVGIDSLTAYH